MALKLIERLKILLPRLWHVSRARLIGEEGLGDERVINSSRSLGQASRASLDQRLDWPQALELYRRWLKETKRPDTMASYLRTLSRFAKYAQSSQRRPFEVDLPEVLGWFADLEKDGVADYSINLYSYNLKNFFAMLGRHDLILRIPSRRWERVGKIRWMERSLVDSIIEAGAEVRGLLGRALLSTAYELALRVNEIPPLQRWHYDPQAPSMLVTRLKRRRQPPPEERVLSMRPFAKQALDEYLSSRTDSSSSLFVNDYTGSSLSHDLINQIYVKAMQRLGLDHRSLTFHTLRHSRLTEMAIEMLKTAGTVDLVRLATFAGHSGLEVTLKYVHLAGKYLEMDITKVTERALKFTARNNSQFA